MKYKIVLSRDAEKAYQHLNTGDFLAISRVIHSLGDEPWPTSAGSVRSARNKGKNYYRIRVRDYRVIYSVDNEKTIVYVERIARRSEKTYRGL